jgi:hypothetical protein
MPLSASESCDLSDSGILPFNGELWGERPMNPSELGRIHFGVFGEHAAEVKSVLIAALPRDLLDRPVRLAAH